MYTSKNEMYRESVTHGALLAHKELNTWGMPLDESSGDNEGMTDIQNLKRALSPDQAFRVRATTGKRARKSVPGDNKVFSSSVSRTSFGAPVGISAAARSDCQRNEAVASGSFTVDARALELFRSKVLKHDLHAQVDKHGLRVFHSVCAQWLVMGAPNQMKNFTRHLPKCKGDPRLVAQPITSFFKKAGPGIRELTKLSTGEGGRKQVGKERPSVRPCRGVTSETHPHVASYLVRPNAGGGGGRSLSINANELFGCPYAELSEDEKESVKQLQKNQWTWRVEYTPAPARIHAIACVQVVIEDGKRCCTACLLVILSEAFRNVTRAGSLHEENWKYANHEYKNEIIGERYATMKGLSQLLKAVRIPALLLLTMNELT
jgi:hypothetical protein